MQEYKVQRSGKKDLAFTGELIGECSVRANHILDPVRCEFQVYQTSGGRYVVNRTAINTITNERLVEAEIFECVDIMTDFIGWSDEAKEMYRKIGVNTEERIG